MTTNPVGLVSGDSGQVEVYLEGSHIIVLDYEHGTRAEDKPCRMRTQEESVPRCDGCHKTGTLRQDGTMLICMNCGDEYPHR